MATAHIRAAFRCGIATVFAAVTSLEDWSWRRDVARVEVREPGRVFVEYTKDGFATVFTITAFEPCRRYAFDMENSRMRGRWTGLFSGKNGTTEVDFTEDVTAGKWYLKPFAGIYLKKQQAAYIADLERKLDSLNR